MWVTPPTGGQEVNLLGNFKLGTIFLDIIHIILDNTS